MKKIRVWDLPVRLFHWAVVLLIIGLVITANIGGNMMDWHFRFGYAMLTLLLFRLVWGLVGTRYARFANFLYGPGAIMAYLRGLKSPRPGHNPLGSVSVFGLLAVLIMQASSGLFSNDDIAYDGPMVKFISKELSEKFTWFHTEVSLYLVFLFTGLHLLAIAFYFFVKKKNLLTPMLSGDVTTELDAPAAEDSAARRWLALLILGACAALVYFIVNLKR